MMGFVSALRRIAEVIELEKASGGAVARLRPTAGEEFRVPAKPGGFSPSPTSFRSASKNLRPTPHREAARRGPRGELANLPEECRSRAAGSRVRFDGASNALERL